VPVYLGVYDRLGYRGIAHQARIEGNPIWKSHFEATKGVPEVALSDLEWADAIIFSVPTRFGNMPSQMKQFFDTAGGLWSNGKLANKVVSAMTSAENRGNHFITLYNHVSLGSSRRYTWLY
jgi:multimeric flavodoxin WrbA